LTLEISGTDISEKGLNCLHLIKQLVEKYFSTPKNSTFNCFEILKKKNRTVAINCFGPKVLKVHA